MQWTVLFAGIKLVKVGKNKLFYKMLKSQVQTFNKDGHRRHLGIFQRRSKTTNNFRIWWNLIQRCRMKGLVWKTQNRFWNEIKESLRHLEIHLDIKTLTCLDWFWRNYGIYRSSWVMTYVIRPSFLIFFLCNHDDCVKISVKNCR